MPRKPTVDELLRSLSRHPDLLHELAQRIHEGEIQTLAGWMKGSGHLYSRSNLSGDAICKVKRVRPGEWKWSVHIPEETRLGGTGNSMEQAKGFADEVLAGMGYNLVPPVVFPKYAEPWSENHIHGSMYLQRRDLKGNALASVVASSPIPGKVGSLYMGTDPEAGVLYDSIEEAQEAADTTLTADGWILR